jgi:pyruvate kinase
MPYAHNSDELVDLAVDAAEEAGLVKNGDLVVITAGVPVGIAGTTNMIRVKQVGGSLINAIGIGSQKTSGPLCVCRSQEEVKAKCKEGDILVVPYTTNEILPWLRKAAAIITEDTTPDCHAATIGLALEKPVIIAALGATRRLKDGIMVSVDCSRSVVQTLPE